MKKTYISPNTELVKVCGLTQLLDNKFGNSDGVTKGGDSGDYSGEEQGAKHHSVWDDEDPLSNGGLWN